MRSRRRLKCAGVAGDEKARSQLLRRGLGNTNRGGLEAKGKFAGRGHDLGKGACGRQTEGAEDNDSDQYLEFASHSKSPLLSLFHAFRNRDSTCAFTSYLL